MKSKILSRALAVAASAAMLATMATTAFAAGPESYIYSGDKNKSDATVEVTIGAPVTLEAVIFNNNSNVSDETKAEVTKWSLQVKQIETATEVTDSTAIAALTNVIDYSSDVTKSAEIAALVTASPKDTTLTGSTVPFVSVAKVAGSDGKEAVVTASSAPATKTVNYKINDSGVKYYTVVTTYGDITLDLEANYGGVACNTAKSTTITVKDSRYKAVTEFTGSKADTKFNYTALASNTAVTIEKDGSNSYVSEIKIGDSTQVTYELLQAIYNQETSVDLIQGDFTYTIDGLNMSSFGSNAVATKVMKLSIGTGNYSRTTRTNIADASKAYGADFKVAIATDPDDREYFPLDLSNITIPDEVGSINVTFDPDDVYEGGDLADAAADGELYMYLYDDGEFTLFDTVETTGRRDSLLTFEMEDGDQGQYILTTTKLEKGATTSSEAPASSSSAPASSTPASSSSETIPNTGDANVVAIAVMMAVIALGGAAVVAKKATK